jgi:hypothetical protein
MDKIIEEIVGERKAQDAKWGGPEHDDHHGPDDWIGFINDKLTKAEEAAEVDETNPDAIFRRRMLQVAALALASIESLDRFTERQKTLRR